jgi:predicted AAA+ superfamily ATPase
MRSARWREAFIRSYLEKDRPQPGPRIAAATLRRFWTMLAHEHGDLLNAAQLARSPAASGKTLASYVDLFVDLCLLRRPRTVAREHRQTAGEIAAHLSPRQRLLRHLLGLGTMEDLLGYSRMGASWEGFAIENIIASLPEDSRALFYRSAAGAEINLILELPGCRRPWALEIRRWRTPKLERGFHHAREDMNPERCLVVCGTDEPFPMGNGIEAMGLADTLQLLNG